MSTAEWLILCYSTDYIHSQELTADTLLPICSYVDHIPSRKQLYKSPMATAAVARKNNVRKIHIFSCFNEKGLFQGNRTPKRQTLSVPVKEAGNSFPLSGSVWAQLEARRAGRAFGLAETGTGRLGNLGAGSICSLCFSHLVPLPIQVTKAISSANKEMVILTACVVITQPATPGFAGLPFVQSFVQ